MRFDSEVVVHNRIGGHAQGNFEILVWDQSFRKRNFVSHHHLSERSICLRNVRFEMVDCLIVKFEQPKLLRLRIVIDWKSYPVRRICSEIFILIFRVYFVSVREVMRGYLMER